MSFYIYNHQIVFYLFFFVNYFISVKNQLSSFLSKFPHVFTRKGDVVQFRIHRDKPITFNVVKFQWYNVVNNFLTKNYFRTDSTPYLPSIDVKKIVCKLLDFLARVGPKPPTEWNL
jgi:hypothetical protein